MEKNYDFRKILECVHKKNRRNPDAIPLPGEVFLDPEWRIVIPPDSDELILYAAGDLHLFLKESMNLVLSRNVVHKRKWKFSSLPSPGMGTQFPIIRNFSKYVKIS